MKNVSLVGELKSLIEARFMEYLQAIKHQYSRLSQWFGLGDAALGSDALYTIVGFEPDLMVVWLKTPYAYTSFAVMIHEIHNRGFVDGMSPVQAFFLGQKLGEAHEKNKQVKGVFFQIGSWKYLPSDSTHTRICSITRDKKIELFNAAKNVRFLLYPSQLTIDDPCIMDFYPRTAHYLGYESARYKARSGYASLAPDSKNDN